MSPEPACDVSVIIVNWNLKDYLLDAVASVGETAGEYSFEIIVVDNASEDGSVVAVKEQFPEVRLIENRENLGFGTANNQGFEIAVGRYFLLLNNDAKLLEGALDSLVREMDASPDIAISGGQLLNADLSLQNSFDNVPSIATELLNKAILRRIFPSRYPSKLQETVAPREVEVVIGAMMMIRRSVIDEIKGFDPGYFMFLEETDLCHRAAIKGYRLVQFPEARAIHHQGTSSVRRLPGLSRVEFYRSRYRFFKKWYSCPVYLLFRIGCFLKLFPNLFFNLVAAICTLFQHKKTRDRVSIYWTLLGWHLRGCPEGFGIRHPKA
ncbi:MAG: glycosyltransferase family 2 protein [Planctomycetota bacterium]|nr:glycosyltransferase family 2 protein [Planctomycetota bacterium]MDA1142449.1 glycosyltransferase family 2 protein [Planctomycetota bacterium]